MAANTCASCKIPLSETSRYVIPRPIAWLGAFALAPAHAGMWAKEELERPFCRSCGRRAVALVSLAGLGVLGLAAAGALVWMRHRA